jgi:outer membrane murein-binding lipoprotein Lpp
MMSVRKAIIKGVASIAIVSAVVLGLSLVVGAIETPKLKVISSDVGAAPELSAKLSDPEKKAQEHTATVEVKVAGIQLIDPAAVNEQPQQGQGHLHYQVDTGPVIATTSTKLSFHELSSGAHEITVMLVSSDHQPLGPSETLTVNIPPALGDRAKR